MQVFASASVDFDNVHKWQTAERAGQGFAEAHSVTMQKSRADAGAVRRARSMTRGIGTFRTMGPRGPVQADALMRWLDTQLQFFLFFNGARLAIHYSGQLANLGSRRHRDSLSPVAGLEVVDASIHL